MAPTGSQGGRQRILAKGLDFGAAFLAARPEEVAQHATALRIEHTALHCCLVVQQVLAEKVDDRTGGTGLRVRSPEHDTAKPGMEHRARTHRTGLERDVQRAAVEAVVA